MPGLIHLCQFMSRASRRRIRANHGEANDRSTTSIGTADSPPRPPAHAIFAKLKRKPQAKALAGFNHRGPLPATTKKEEPGGLLRRVPIRPERLV
jgi:hypothetical protein